MPSRLTTATRPSVATSWASPGPPSPACSSPWCCTASVVPSARTASTTRRRAAGTSSAASAARAAVAASARPTVPAASPTPTVSRKSTPSCRLVAHDTPAIGGGAAVFSNDVALHSDWIPYAEDRPTSNERKRKQIYQICPARVGKSQGSRASGQLLVHVEGHVHPLWRRALSAHFRLFDFTFAFLEGRGVYCVCVRGGML